MAKMKTAVGRKSEPQEAPAPAAPAAPAATTPVRLPRRAPSPRPEYHAFARKLREAMEHRQLSASDLARAIWGTATDYRGYDVARNRDRIGHYLAGVSYPEPDNLKKLSEAVGLNVEDLAVDPQARGPAPAAREVRGVGDVQITFLDSRPGVGYVQMKRMLSTQTILQIMALINQDKLPDPEDTDLGSTSAA